MRTEVDRLNAEIERLEKEVGRLTEALRLVLEISDMHSDKAADLIQATRAGRFYDDV
jgi:hypothetical protein